VTIPCAQVSDRRVASLASVSAPMPAQSAAPMTNALSEFHSPSASATTAGTTMTSDRPSTTLPR
jgi:hypothetical protein